MAKILYMPNAQNNSTYWADFIIVTVNKGLFTEKINSNKFMSFISPSPNCGQLLTFKHY